MKVQELLGDRLGTDIHMYSITLKPEEDTPEILAQYREEWGIKDGWTLLTATPEVVQSLRSKLGFYNPEEPDFGKDLNNHLGFMWLGNEPFGWWGSCSSTSAPTQILQLMDWNVPEAVGFQVPNKQEE